MKNITPLMKPGAVVKYSKPQTDTEAKFRFVLRHCDEHIAEIQLICDWAIKPIETVSISEVALCES